MSFIFLGTNLLLGQSGLEYRKRGDRYEGLMDRLVGASRKIDIVSAMVTYEDKAPQIPDSLKIRYCLDQPRTVYVSVREKIPNVLYGMDTTRPASGSRGGFQNEYQWSTGEVIRKIDGFTDMYQLAVLARLDEKTGFEQSIVPVIFYHTNLPRSVSGYLFTFVSPADANIEWTFSDVDGRRLSSGVHKGAARGDLVEVAWNASRSDGWYKLSIHAAAAISSSDVYGVVHFFHCNSLSR
jgi:hypothetical protein